MKYCNVALKPDEKAIYDLRELYLLHGYRHYKVGKFEEYDLYAANKSFLKGDSILSFTDTDGKLMALKPDVTLSIIKNVGDDEGATHKFFYNENVYRTSASFGGFREIMQTGLECIGKIDTYSICEVLTLAEESLRLIDDNYLLALSHMGFISGLFEECGFDELSSKESLSYISSKNAQALRVMAESFGVSDKLCDALVFVAKFYGKLSLALDTIKDFCFNDKMRGAYDELLNISSTINDCELYADFSLVNDMNYYNGIIFKGYINGIPESILSGGRYDSLVHKMGKKMGAIGFAVYLDLLERFYDEGEQNDVDVLLLYDDESSPADVMAAVRELSADNKKVKALRENDGKKYRSIAKMSRGEVTILEKND